MLVDKLLQAINKAVLNDNNFIIETVDHMAVT